MSAGKATTVIELDPVDTGRFLQWNPEEMRAFRFEISVPDGDEKDPDVVVALPRLMRLAAALWGSVGARRVVFAIHSEFDLEETLSRFVERVSGTIPCSRRIEDGEVLAATLILHRWEDWQMALEHFWEATTVFAVLDGVQASTAATDSKAEEIPRLDSPRGHRAEAGWLGILAQDRGEPDLALVALRRGAADEFLDRIGWPKPPAP